MRRLERLERASVLLTLVEALYGNNSWAGETHVQKATHLLQGLMGVPLGFNFILYKHGPYSFDLKDELSGMQADYLLTLKPQAPYGPRLVPGKASDLLKKQYSAISRQYMPQIEFVAKKLGGKWVTELEKLATALYVTLEGGGNAENRATRINKLKPHVSLDDAQKAVTELDEIREEAQHLIIPKKTEQSA